MPLYVAWWSKPCKGLFSHSQGKAVLLSYFKTLSTGPAPGIKRSTDWANAAAVLLFLKWIKEKIMGVFCLNKQIHLDVHRTGNSLFTFAPFIYVQSMFFIFSTIVVPESLWWHWISHHWLPQWSKSINYSVIYCISNKDFVCWLLLLLLFVPSFCYPAGHSDQQQP